jgi:molybdate transport system ATP-binding protein
LIDEPLASLDRARKAEILPYLIRLKTSLKLPVLYVTHALDEAVQLADSLVLLDAGRVVGFGAVSDVASCADLPLGQRDDAGAVLLCRVDGHDTDHALTRLQGAGCTFLVPLLDVPQNSECRARIPAREVILAGKPPDAISLHNIIAGTVRRIMHDTVRRSVLVEVGLPSGALLSRVTPDAIARLGLTPGSPVLALIKSTSIEIMASMEVEGA